MEKRPHSSSKNALQAALPRKLLADNIDDGLKVVNGTGVLRAGTNGVERCTSCERLLSGPVSTQTPEGAFAIPKQLCLVREGDRGCQIVPVKVTNFNLDGKRCPQYITYRLSNLTVMHNLDTTFAALADPTRRAILARLAKGETSVTDLAEPFAMSQPAVSKHLKVLERAGLITRGRDAQRRPRRLEARPLRDATNWLENYRQFWDAQFRRLDDLLHDLQAADSKWKKKRKRQKENHS